MLALVSPCRGIGAKGSVVLHEGSTVGEAPARREFPRVFGAGQSVAMVLTLHMSEGKQEHSPKPLVTLSHTASHNPSWLGGGGEHISGVTAA